MLFRRAFRYFAQVLLVTGAVSLVAGGCSRQGEGERCDYYAAGDSDCDDGLECITCIQLAVGPVDRCCNANPIEDSDERCLRGVGAICTPPDLATGGTSGTGGSSSSSSGGEAGGTETSSGGTETAGGTGGTGGTSGTGAAAGVPATDSAGQGS